MGVNIRGKHLNTCKLRQEGSMLVLSEPRLRVCARACACIRSYPLPSWFRLYMGYASFLNNSSNKCSAPKVYSKKNKNNECYEWWSTPAEKLAAPKMSTRKIYTWNDKQNWLRVSWAATATRVDRTVFTSHLSRGVTQRAPRYCVEFAVIYQPPFSTRSAATCNHVTV